MYVEKFIFYVMFYDDIILFCKENNIFEVVIVGDIMSYYFEEYDILY